MKVQLIILSLFVSALALPVPDEEVSPAKPASIGEIKTDIADESLIKTPLADASSIVETLSPKLPAIKIDDEKQALTLATDETKIVLVGTPDAELAVAASEQKPELKEKEKNIRAENQVAEETKSLPTTIVESPVEPAATEEQKQIVAAEKPSVKDVQLEGKSAELSVAASAVAEEKVPAAIATEIKAVDAAALGDSITAEASEIKTEELSARQERGNEEKLETAAQTDHVQVVAEVPVAAASVNEPEAVLVKSLQPEEKTLAAEKINDDKAEPIVAATELKSTILAEKKPEELKPEPAGDILQPLSSEESITKTLPVEAGLEAKIQESAAPEPVAAASAPVAATLPEGKKIEESATLAGAVVLPEQQPQQQIKEQPLVGDEKPLKKILDDSSEDKKASVESKESAESTENKSKSDDNLSKSDENTSN